MGQDATGFCGDCGTECTYDFGARTWHHDDDTCDDHDAIVADIICPGDEVTPTEFHERAVELGMEAWRKAEDDYAAATDVERQLFRVYLEKHLHERMAQLAAVYALKGGK